MKSSNIGAADFALSVGDQKFYEYIRRFGFGDRTGVELPGRNGEGLIRPTTSLEQDFHHPNSDGSRNRRYPVANDGRDGNDREWRQS